MHMNYSIKVDVWKTKDFYGAPDETKSVGDYCSQEAAEVDIKNIEFRLACAGYCRFKLTIIEKATEARNYCRVCCNAAVEPELTPNNDLSYVSVGKVEKGYGLHIRSGDSKPTALVISKWEESLGRNVDIGVYKMNYCPECGRRLIENVNKRPI